MPAGGKSKQRFLDGLALAYGLPGRLIFHPDGKAIAAVDFFARASTISSSRVYAECDRCFRYGKAVIPVALTEINIEQRAHIARRHLDFGMQAPLRLDTANRRDFDIPAAVDLAPRSRLDDGGLITRLSVERTTARAEGTENGDDASEARRCLQLRTRPRGFDFQLIGAGAPSVATDVRDRSLSKYAAMASAARTNTRTGPNG